MDGFFFILIVLAIPLALYGGYLRLRRNEFIRYARLQERSLKKFIDKAPFHIDARFPLKNGEVIVWELKNASLAETRRGPRITKRQTDAFTFRFAPGFYYTAAGGKSVSDSAEEMAQIDSGRATFTNKRVLFVGQKQTREWDFAKLLGWEIAPGGYIMMAVSNRQKMSGVTGSLNDLMAPVAFELAQIVAEDGFESAKRSANSGIYSAREQANFAEQLTFMNERRVEEHREKIEDLNAQRAEELTAIESEVWVDPGLPLPEKTGVTAAAKKDDIPEAKKPNYGKVPAELEVVGEFFHPEAFEALRVEFGTEGDSEHIVEAELRNDPDNPYSESGMAVAVYVSGQHVGHIPEALAPAIFAMVEAKGGVVRLGARVWLDHRDSRPGKSSVQLFVDSRLTG